MINENLNDSTIFRHLSLLEIIKLLKLYSNVILTHLKKEKNWVHSINILTEF